MAEPKGKYVKKGDVEVWEWDDNGPGAPKLTGGWVVPEGDFDPRGPSDTRSPAEKFAEQTQSVGLYPAEQETVEEKPKKVVTTKTAEPLTKKK
jgi:hypothetical protein